VVGVVAEVVEDIMQGYLRYYYNKEGGINAQPSSSSSSSCSLAYEAAGIRRGQQIVTLARE
jgi:hypothetical protein